jgi:hypothetical protein
MRTRERGEPLLGFLERATQVGCGSVLAEGPVDALVHQLAEMAALPHPSRLPVIGARMRGGEDGRPASMVSSDEGERAEALAAAVRAGRAAVAAGARLLILRVEAPRIAEEAGVAPVRSADGVLDRLCRSLHRLGLELPGCEICLAPGATDDELPRPDDLEPICDELGRRAPGFWHDTAAAALRAQLGGYSADRWLDGAADRLRGVTLHDTDGSRTGLPPGAGLVRTEGLAAALPAGAPVVLGLAPEFAALGWREAVEVARRLLRG